MIGYFRAMVRAPRVLLVLLASAAVGCVKQEARPPRLVRPAYLAGVPVVPFGTVEDTAGASDYQQLVYLAPVPMDSAAAFYRRGLTARRWVPIADHGDTTQVTQYWQNDSVSLWVRIAAGKPVCRVTLIAAARHAAQAADTGRPPAGRGSRPKSPPDVGGARREGRRGAAGGS